MRVWVGGDVGMSLMMRFEWWLWVCMRGNMVGAGDAMRADIWMLVAV